MLLLDEPLGALDLKLRRQMQVELKRIQTEVGLTFIHVTHDQEEAMTMADTVAVMNHGRIEQMGHPEAMYDLPSTAFVATFLGQSNLGEGKVVDIAIQRTAEALLERDADVMLVSHDGDFLPQLEPLLGGSRKVGLIGFKEFRNAGFSPLEAQGLEFFDLEHDVKAFNATLPRLRIIPIDEFDPIAYL